MALHIVNLKIPTKSRFVIF